MYDRKKELEAWIAGRDPLEQETYNAVKDDILTMCEKFDDTGQSGHSAPFMAGMVGNLTKKLMLGIVLNPVTEETVDWSCGHFEENTCQSRVVSSLFMNKETGNIYYLDALSWCIADSSCWHGSAIVIDKDGVEHKIGSKVNNLSFPFMPKTFHIDVIEKPIGDDPKDTIFYVKNYDDLLEVFEYYNITIDNLKK